MARRRFGRYVVETTNEDKVLFPDDGITKGDLIDYYVDIADTILPHLRDRPLTLQRFPDGIGEEGFYQKAMPDYFPDWVDSVDLRTGEGPQRQVVCSNAATLAYLSQQACITPHVWPSRRDRLARPDRLIIDLDPADDDFEPVRSAALAARELFDEIELPSFVMTTGSRGAHVVVPLDRSQTFDEVRGFAAAVARVLAARNPEALTTEQRRGKRGGRLYLDVGNNAYGQTTAAPYAVRARAGAPVATPVQWSELASAKLGARRWTLGSMRRRLAGRTDPWRGLARRARSLASAQVALDAMR